MADFILDPYFGDVNPGSIIGFKLYNKAIKPPEEKLTIDQTNAWDIQATFERDPSNFGWGPAISSIQIDNTTPPVTRIILSKVREISIKCITKLTHRTWRALAAMRWTDPVLDILTVFDINPAVNIA